MGIAIVRADYSGWGGIIAAAKKRFINLTMIGKCRRDGRQNEMAAEQNINTYEVGFSTDKFQHIFYISCPDDSDAKSFAHAVFHYYDTPADWGSKQCITSIAAIKPDKCLPDFLHVSMQAKKELAMPEENAESHQAVREMIRQAVSDGFVPMAIYDEEKKTMTVYATQKLEAAPQTGAASVVLNFSNFGGLGTKAR